MEEFEADDAIATAALRWMDDPEVEQVVVCSPDKDLAQVVSGNRESLASTGVGKSCWTKKGVAVKFGVPPGFDP